MTKDDLLNIGVSTLQTGQKTEARCVFEQILQEDRANEKAWCWLSFAVGTDLGRHQCLEEVLAINPGNALAGWELEGLPRKQPPARGVSYRRLGFLPTEEALGGYYEDLCLFRSPHLAGRSPGYRPTLPRGGSRMRRPYAVLWRHL
jgi:hypothetical protein